MGLFDKLTKRRMSILDYASEITLLTSIQESVANLFYSYTLAAQAESYTTDEENDFHFIIPEEPLKERAFWKAYFVLLRQGFGGAQLSCEIAENRNLDITLAFYNALELSHESIMNEMTDTKEPKGIQPFEMPPSIEVSGEKTWMLPLLNYLYDTGNSKEHLEFFMTVDSCVEGFFEFSSSLEQQFLPILNQAIITDWE
jgi:hypothetical protein